MATQDTSEFGKLTLKTVVTNFVDAGINLDAGGTAGDLVLSANNGDSQSFAKTNVTFHHDSTPTLTFSTNTQIKGIANPSANSDVATKEYVDNNAGGGGGPPLMVLSGNNLATANINGTTAWVTGELMAGFVIRNTTSDAIDTLPTAALMIAALPNAQVGTNINLTIHKTGTHKVTFASNTTGGADGIFAVGGTAQAQSTIPVVLNNLRSTTVKIVVRNITPGALLCEMVMLSDR